MVEQRHPLNLSIERSICGLFMSGALILSTVSLEVVKKVRVSRSNRSMIAIVLAILIV